MSTAKADARIDREALKAGAQGFFAPPIDVERLKAKVFGVGGFEKDLVVKQILPQYARYREFVDMFIDEARIVQGVTTLGAATDGLGVIRYAGVGLTTIATTVACFSPGMPWTEPRRRTSGAGASTARPRAESSRTATSSWWRLTDEARNCVFATTGSPRAR